MPKAKPQQFALLLMIILLASGCSIPDDVRELMDSEGSPQSSKAFSLTSEDLYRIGVESAGKTQPPPL